MSQTTRIVCGVWTEDEFDEDKRKEVERIGAKLCSETIKVAAQDTKGREETIFWAVSTANKKSEDSTTDPSASSSASSSSSSSLEAATNARVQQQQMQAASPSSRLPATPPPSQASKGAGYKQRTPASAASSFKRPKLTAAPRDTQELRKLKKERDSLKEKLRKLELVRTYRSKHDTADLDELIPKWRGVCQEALQDLADSHPEANVKQLIQFLTIPPDLIKFNMEDEEFE